VNNKLYKFIILQHLSVKMTFQSKTSQQWQTTPSLS